MNLNNENRIKTKNKIQIINFSLILIILLTLFVGYKNFKYKSYIKEAEKNEKNEFFIKNEDELNKFLSDKRPSILFFGSKTCSACIGTKRDAELLYEDFINDEIDVSIGYIEVTETPELIEKYPIQQTPSVLVFDREGNAQKFRKRDTQELNMHYVKDKNKDKSYNVFLGIPDMKRLKKAIQIISENKYI